MDKDLEAIFDKIVSCPTITRLLENGKTKEAARGSALLASLEAVKYAVDKELEKKQKEEKSKDK